VQLGSGERRKMQSTSVSKILEIKDLHLVFHTYLYKKSSVREMFIDVFHNPIELFSQRPDRLYLLKGISLTAQPGDKIGLVGINGSGKTTLCRCIAGIYKPTRGEINIHGNVRALFDTSIGFYPELTGRENAELMTQLMYPQQDTEKELQDALTFSGLEHFLDTPFKFYSNGMQARLCLSIASMLPADLIILDEVFEGADQFFKEKIASRIENLINTSGASIFVSHSFQQIHRVCNRVLILKDGHIVFDGKPDVAEKEFLKLHTQ
jgi:ABC-2 type transport system ATP-binding protein